MARPVMSFRDEAIIKYAEDYINLSEKLINLERGDFESAQSYVDSLTRLNLLTREARRRLALAVR